jgi:hypothetical protein
MREYRIRLVGGTGDEHALIINEQIEDSCRITCRLRDETHQAQGSDFFEAFREIRRCALEPKGLIPFCYGASLKVWPSAMARDMGSGLQAYKIDLDAPAGDLVGIFDEGPDIIPAKVDAQEEFAREWFNSPKR